MAVFKGLGKKITQTGQGAVTKTKIAAETMKMNNRIAEAERAVSAYCDLIGRAYYEKYAVGGWDSDFDEMFIGIESEKEKIEECKLQLRTMRGVVECLGCGKELPIDTNYCSNCGTKIVLPASVRLPEPEPVVGETEKETDNETEQEEAQKSANLAEGEEE